MYLAHGARRPHVSAAVSLYIELHWLPMQKRIEFKILMLMRNCLAGQAPVYLRELCVPVLSIPGRRFLRSATQGDLVVPVARTSMVLHKSFAVVGPSFWNRLPSNLRNELLDLPCLFSAGV